MREPSASFSRGNENARTNDTMVQIGVGSEAQKTEDDKDDVGVADGDLDSQLGPKHELTRHVF